LRAPAVTTITRILAAIGVVLLATTPAGAAKSRAVARAGSCAPARPVRPNDIYLAEQAMTPAQLIARWQPCVGKAARRAGVPVAWINAVMRVESGGRTMLTGSQRMVSAKGAMGLMQLLPQTYHDMRVQYRLGADPFEPRDNISAGAGYLRWLRGKYGYPTMFAAYNAGPGQVEDIMGGAKKLPAETRAYVARISEILGKGRDGAMIDALKLTRPDGETVLVDPLAVGSVRAPLPGEYDDSVQAVLAMGRLSQAVREPVAAVAAAIRIRGGKL
jgi:soluble lytic murein transglycosylase-like protein